MRAWRLLLLLLSTCFYASKLVPMVQAQSLPESSSASSKEGSTESPRFMMRQFLDLMKRDDVEGAISFVEFPRRMNQQRQRNLVRQLMDVLNKKGQIDIADISDLASGRTIDGLLPDAEIIGQIKLNGQTIPIELRRGVLADEDRKVWRFAPEFMDKIPAMAEQLPGDRIEARLPLFLVENSLLGVKAWQWTGLLVSIVLAFVISRLLAFILIKLTNFATRRYKIFLSSRTLKRFVPPLRWLTGLLVFKLAHSFLELKLNTRQSLLYFEGIVLALALAFLGMRLVEALIELSRRNFERQGKSAASGMLQPIQKGGKVLVVAIALIWLFRGLGFDVTAIIAGLGVGGLAIALAGQKTIENLFGGISVLLDQPVRVGDTGRFGDVIGTVEDIGLRSTKVRTLDRTLVTIPNAEFSLIKIENFERRDKIRWAPTLSIRYDTKPDQMRLLLMRLKELLIGHPMVMNDPARVRFVRLGASSLDIEIFSFISTSDYNMYLAVIEDLNLKVMQIVSDCGTDFAFASSTVYLERSHGIDPEKRDKAIEEAREVKARAAFPQPHYSPEWVEPRQDVLVFGPEKAN